VYDLALQWSTKAQISFRNSDVVACTWLKPASYLYPSLETILMTSKIILAVL